MNREQQDIRRWWWHESGASTIEYVAFAAVAVTLLGVVAAGFGGDTSLGQAMIATLERFVAAAGGGATAGVANLSPTQLTAAVAQPTYGVPLAMMNLAGSDRQMLLAAVGATAAGGMAWGGIAFARSLLSPAAVGGGLGGAISAALANLRLPLIGALRIAQPNLSFGAALAKTRMLPTRAGTPAVRGNVGANMGWLAESRYLSRTNRIWTLLRHGYWIEDAQRHFVNLTSSGIKSPVIDFIHRPLVSRNPAVLFWRLVRGQSLLVSYNSPRAVIVSAKSGPVVANNFNKLRNFRGGGLDLTTNMPSAWRTFLQRFTANQRWGVTTNETLANLRSIGMQGRGVGSIRSLQRAVTPWHGQWAYHGGTSTPALSNAQILRARFNPANLASLRGWTKGGVWGAVISSVLSAWTYRALWDTNKAAYVGNVGADAIGGFGAAIAGMYVGGVIGSFIPVPIVGTVVGAVVGLVVGLAVGVLYDMFLREYVVTAITFVGEKLGQLWNAAGDFVSSVWNGGQRIVSGIFDGGKKVLNWFGIG
jgi:hypothetical protein